MKKLLFILVSLVGILYFYLSYSAWFKLDSFKVYFFDVGQGDSALIIAPGGKTILIDGGPDNKVLRGLGEVMPFWQRQIDLLIITHAHDDHISGLTEITRRYQIKQVLYNNLDFDTPALNMVNEIFKEKKLKMILAKEGMSFNFLSNCSLSILAASKELYLAENDYSIVTNFNCLNKNILFTGDAGIKIENYLLNKKINLSADILKIAHHGSTSASSEAFLRAVNPRAVVISVGINNKFNHPSPLTIDKLQKLTVDIYRTDQLGMIGFLANNNTIKLLK